MIQVRCQLTNPGQFFACCGLLELADRLWNGAEGWFDGDGFRLRSTKGNACTEQLSGLIGAIGSAALRQTQPNDDHASPLEILSPFNLRLDWWLDGRSDGEYLKIWAGSMSCVHIARAMQAPLRDPNFQTESLLDRGVLLQTSEDDKREPFYFDGRRGVNAQPLDVGFSQNKLKMKTLAHPAVELLCLVGLQRFRPRKADTSRSFEYFEWLSPLTLPIAALAACGILVPHATWGFRFETPFRTDKRMHKAFSMATPI